MLETVRESRLEVTNGATIRSLAKAVLLSKNPSAIVNRIRAISSDFTVLILNMCVVVWLLC